MYYIVEVFGNKARMVKQEIDLNRAKDSARNHSIRTGLMVEIHDELGRLLEQEFGRRDDR